MPRARITKDWRLAIPKEVRDSLELKPGDEVDFLEQPDGFVITKHLESPFEKWRGILGPLEPGKTVDDLIDDMRGR